MSNGSDEIADIRKRLEAIERAIDELRAGALAKTEKIDSAGKTLEKVDNAEEAIDIAQSFMKRDCSVALPLKAVRRDDVWLVDIDIGAVKVEIVRVKLDAKTGEILGHDIVEKK